MAYVSRTWVRVLDKAVDLSIQHGYFLKNLHASN